MNRFAVWLLYVFAYGVVSLTLFGSADAGVVVLLFLVSLIPCHLLIDWADKYYVSQDDVEMGPFSIRQLVRECEVGNATQVVKIRQRWSSRWRSVGIAVDPPPRFGYGFLGLCLGAILGLIAGSALFGRVKTPLTDAGGTRIDVAYVFESPKPSNYMYVGRQADPTFKTVVREGAGIAGDSGVPVVNVLGKAVQATDRVIEEHNKSIDNAILYMRSSTVFGALGLAVLFGSRNRYRLVDARKLPQTRGNQRASKGPSSQKLSFDCINCKKRLSGATHLAGQMISCPACKTRQQVPYEIAEPGAAADGRGM